MTPMMKIDRLLVTKGTHVFFDEPFQSRRKYYPRL